MKSLSDLFHTITSTLLKPLNDLKYRNISEDTIRSQIEDLRWKLNTVTEAYNSLSNTQLEKMYQLVKTRLQREPAILKSVYHAESFILSIDKTLKGKARSLGFFKSINLVSKSMASLLDKLEALIPVLLANKEGVVINDMQISHALFFGMLEAINIFSTVNSYLLVLFSHIATMTSDSQGIARYIIEYILKHQEAYFNLIDQFCNGNGDQLMNKINNLKRQGLDLKLSTTNEVVRRIVPEPLTLTLIGIFAAFTVVIPYIGDIYINSRHWFYEFNKTNKNWLESHVANIRMTLEETDPNDPEYIKLQNIIKYYDDEIAKLDKQLQNYLG